MTSRPVTTCPSGRILLYRVISYSRLCAAASQSQFISLAGYGSCQPAMKVRDVLERMQAELQATLRNPFRAALGDLRISFCLRLVIRPSWTRTYRSEAP